MFGNIRRKLNDVISEGLNISESISSNYLKPSSSTFFDSAKADFGIPSDINLSAGCKLLAKNEETWSELHEHDEQNAQMAEVCDTSISRMKERTDKLNVDLKDMNACLSMIPAILEDLKVCNNMIINVGLLCRSLDTKLVEFEDVTEEIDLQQMQLQHKFEMSLYQQKKMAELEEVRMKLGRKHAENVRQYENGLKKIQQERQAVFQDAFQHDLQVYKQQGTIPKVEHIKKDSLIPELSLEEITLEDADSKNELEDFLKD